MNRRGFLTALASFLGAVGVSWSAKRVTATEINMLAHAHARGLERMYLANPSTPEWPYLHGEPPFRTLKTSHGLINFIQSKCIPEGPVYPGKVIQNHAQSLTEKQFEEFLEVAMQYKPSQRFAWFPEDEGNRKLILDWLEKNEIRRS